MILPDFFGKQQRGKPSKIDLPVGDGGQWRHGFIGLTTLEWLRLEHLEPGNPPFVPVCLMRIDQVILGWAPTMFRSHMAAAHKWKGEDEIHTSLIWSTTLIHTQKAQLVLIAGHFGILTSWLRNSWLHGDHPFRDVFWAMAHIRLWTCLMGWTNKILVDTNSPIVLCFFAQTGHRCLLVKSLLYDDLF